MYLNNHAWSWKHWGKLTLGLFCTHRPRRAQPVLRDLGPIFCQYGLRTRVYSVYFSYSKHDKRVHIPSLQDVPVNPSGQEQVELMNPVFRHGAPLKTSDIIAHIVSLWFKGKKYINKITNSRVTQLNSNSMYGSMTNKWTLPLMITHYNSYRFCENVCFLP